jgi:O-antigen/teichoic acid export membrane protein
MSLLGAAVSQVYYPHAVTEYRAGRLAPFTADVIGKLARVGVGPLVFTGIVAPTLFPPLFGPGWARAGVLVSWMTPWFVCQFLSSPVSMLLYVTSNQFAAMALQLGGFALRTAAVLAAALVIAGRPVSEAYALSGCAFYAAYLVVLQRAGRIGTGDVLDACRPAVPVVLAWVLAGIIVAVIL